MPDGSLQAVTFLAEDAKNDSMTKLIDCYIVKSLSTCPKRIY